MQQEKKPSLFLHKQHTKAYDIDFKTNSLLEHFAAILIDHTLSDNQTLVEPRIIDDFACSNISLYLKILGTYITQLNKENIILKKNATDLNNMAKIQKNSLLITKFSSVQFSIYQNMDDILKSNTLFFELLHLKIVKEFSSHEINNDKITLEAIKYIDQNPELLLEIPLAINSNRTIMVNVTMVDSYKNKHLSQLIAILDKYKKKHSKLSMWFKFAKKINLTKLINHLKQQQQAQEKLLFESLFEYVNQQLLPSLPPRTVSSTLSEELNLTQDLEEKFFGNLEYLEEKQYSKNNINSILNETVSLVLAYREYLIKEKKSKERITRFNSLRSTTSTIQNPLALHGSIASIGSTNSMSPHAGTSLLKQFSRKLEGINKAPPTPTTTVPADDTNQEQGVTILEVMRNKSIANTCRS